MLIKTDVITQLFLHSSHLFELPFRKSILKYCIACIIKSLFSSCLKNQNDGELYLSINNIHWAVKLYTQTFEN